MDKMNFVCIQNIVVVLFQYEEMDFDRIKREIKLEETPNLKNQVMITYSGITARSNIEFSGCIKYVEQMEKLFHDYSNMSIKCKGFGPIRLVECPACTVQYKNSPDRLIRLFNHVNKCHRKKRMKFLQEILDSYYPLIRFMEKVLRIPAIQGPSYKN